MRGWLLTISMVLLAGILALPAWPQIMAGAFSFATSPAKPLINSMKAAQGVKSFGFCSGVGGVAFNAVSEFTDGSRVIGLSYHPSETDGQRLRIVVEKEKRQHTIILPVHDWIAIPVAGFAEGEQGAIFTLFGELQDTEEDRNRKQAGQRILNYHTSFNDTLLGLRLMQADLLAFHNIAPENIYENNHPITGPGEQLRDVDRNQRDFEELNKIYHSGNPRSYVITDVDQGVRIHLTENNETVSLKFQGRPYWACWRLSKDIEVIQEEFLQQPDLDDQFTQRMMEKISSGSVRMEQGVSEEEFIRQLGAQESQAMLEEYIDTNYFQQLPDLSRSLSDRMAALEGGNPPVYQALVKTMLYSALFRHIKAESPQIYNSFMRQISGVQPEPQISTPTVLIPPSD